MARRWGFWAGVLALAAAGSSSVLQQADPQPKLFGAFSYLAFQNNLVDLIPVFVGLTVAGSLAADRRRRYPALVLARGISRTRYLLTKAAAMAAAAGFGTFLSCALVFVAAAFFLPWGPMIRPEYADRGSMGPYPGLLESYPLVNDVALAALLSLGAAALAMSGLAFGAMVANEFVAAAVPFVIFIGGTFVFRDDLLFLAPYTNLDLLTSYPYSLPPWAWSFTAPVYWSVFACVCVATAAIIFLRKEEV